jgi:hypothetical protein
LDTVALRAIKSRDDSLNSSDSEFTTGDDSVGERETPRRRSKVNLRQLEERLNMIQEECNRLSEEEDRSTEYSGTEGDREDRDREFSTDRDRNTDDDGDRQRLSEESDDERSVTIDENSDRLD